MKTNKPSGNHKKNNSEDKETHNGEENIEAAPPEEARENEEPPAETGKAEKDPVEVLSEQLNEKEEQIRELCNEILRVKADTENVRKRLRKEKDDFVQFANEKLIKDLIPIKDNLERALSAPNTTVESLKQGVEMILKQFDTFLEKEKVEPIEALGKTFDPSLHEVLHQEETDACEENTVTQEYSKGYYLNGRILRPAKVVVAKPPTNKKAQKPGKKESGDTEEAEESESSTVG
ncbi:MAG: nucleotide exchange factor GrpE [Nitrospinaceae bacterium]